MSEVTESSTAAVESVPPPAPREMTAGARRAAWGQPVVRFWVGVAGVLLLVMAWLLVGQVVEWSREGRLVREGEVVQAAVYEAGVKIKGKAIPPLSGVDLNYEYKGTQYKVTGELAERPTGPLLSGQMIPIRIDPENPKVWTSRTEPAPLAGRLVGPLMLLPAVLLTGLVGWWQRRRAAGLWVSGEAREAVVVDAKQSPLAPTSQAVRCALVGGTDKRLISVYVPGRGGRVKKGDRVWLVTQPGNPQRAVAARGFMG